MRQPNTHRIPENLLQTPTNSMNEPYLGLSEARILVASIERMAKDLNACYDSLSPKAQASAVELGNTMSQVRGKLVTRVNVVEVKRKYGVK